MAMEIPVKTIVYQTINLSILFGGLIYFLRQTVKDFFAGRSSQFVAAANKSEEARAQAEQTFVDIKHKLDVLAANQDETIARANADATELRNKLLAEARELAAKMKSEAGATADAEIQRAKRELQEKFVAETVGAARALFQKDLGIQDHQKLQSEFNTKIEAVRS